MKNLTITVSGKSGTGKTTIAKAIADAFDLEYVNVGDLFREVAKEKGIDLETFSGVRDKELDIEADKRTLELAQKGNVVLNGRLTGWIAKEAADVKVFVKTDIDLIAKRVAERDSKTVEDAKQDLIERDEKDTQRYKELYGINVEDMNIYDIIIDNSKLTFEQAKIIPVKKVKEFLKNKGLIQ